MRKRRLWSLVATLVLVAIASPPVGAGESLKEKIKKGGQGLIDVATTPVRVGEAAVEGKSVSDELDRTAEGAVNAVNGASAVLQVTDAVAPDPQGPATTQPQPDPTGGSNFDGQTALAVAIILWVMLDEESFCQTFNPHGSCNTNANVSVDQDGNVSTSGGGSRPATAEDIARASDPTLFGWMQKQFLQPWEHEVWDTAFSQGSLVPHGVTSGVTWFADRPGNVTATSKLREEEGGSPLMGSRRTDGNETRLHLGTDLASAPGEPVYAAFDGAARYVPNAHKVFGMIVVTSSSGHRQETLYVLPLPSRDSKPLVLRTEQSWPVKRGEVVALADDIHKPGGYKPQVPNHVHNQFRSPEGLYLAPNNKFAIAKDSAWIAENCDSRCISHEAAGVPLK